MLMSEIPREALALLSEGEQAFGADAIVEDFDALTSTWEGGPTTILHLLDSPKPREPSGWLRLPRRTMFDLCVGFYLRPTFAYGSIPTRCRCGFGRIAVAISLFELSEPRTGRSCGPHARFRSHFRRGFANCVDGPPTDEHTEEKSTPSRRPSTMSRNPVFAAFRTMRPSKGWTG
jgi:hypothetical protein